MKQQGQNEIAKEPHYLILRIARSEKDPRVPLADLDDSMAVGGVTVYRD